MRVFFFLVFLAGLAASVGYPWAMRNVGGHDIGTWHVYDSALGNQITTVPLQASDAPVNVEVEITTSGTPNFAGGGAVLTLVVDSGGRTVLAQPVTFATSKPRDTNPQLQEKIYRDSAGVIDTVADGPYRFTIGAGDAEGVAVKSAELILRSGPKAIDGRVQPVGFALTAIGFIGFVLAWRGRTPSNPNSQPPARRWGRGGTS